ncbi:hypothetical protein BHE74_00027184 [Ensete ventricosum]|nr:hypothetical protein BHE74_00027184 [Ensete ventricosum]
MADAFEDEAEQTVTIDEYIEELEAEELVRFALKNPEADLVLGGDEGKECTYPRGYMKRQAIFSCLTCVPGGTAGVCTACSLSCHDGHEVGDVASSGGDSRFCSFITDFLHQWVPVAEILGNSSSSGSKPESVSTKEECVCDKEYLTDKEDTIEEYEKMAKSKREEKLKQQEGAEMNFLNTLDHVQKIEILSGIADMKNEFRTFLLHESYVFLYLQESFDQSKPVTSEDIKGVFENLAKKKKQRLS